MDKSDTQAEYSKGDVVVLRQMGRETIAEVLALNGDKVKLNMPGCIDHHWRPTSHIDRVIDTD